MNQLVMLLPLLLNSVKGQERAVATSTLTGLLNAENTRVNAGLTPDQIVAAVGAVVQLALAEEDALAALLTKKLAK